MEADPPPAEAASSPPAQKPKAPQLLKRNCALDLVFPVVLIASVILILVGLFDQKPTFLVGGLLGGPFLFFYFLLQEPRPFRSEEEQQRAKAERRQIRLLPLLVYTFGLGLVISFFVERLIPEVNQADFVVRILGGVALMFLSMVFDNDAKRRERVAQDEPHGD